MGDKNGAGNNKECVRKGLDMMNGTAIVKAAMSETGTTQVKLSQMLGYKGQGTVSQRINTMRMSLDKFVEMLSAMGYEVIVRKPVVDEEGEIIEYEDKWGVKPPEGIEQ